MQKWSRGLDAAGRLFSLCSEGDRTSIYFPDESGRMFRLASGGGSVGFGLDNVRDFKEDVALADLAPELEKLQVVLEVPSRRTPGEYFPRIHLGPETPHPRDVGLLNEWIATVRSTRALFAHMRDVFRTIEPVRAHDGVHGHELRQLLILACTEVESAWKSILRANGYSPINDKSWSLRDYAHLRDPLGLEFYSVHLSSHRGYGEIAPFEGWMTNKTLPWYQAYNRVKHDREGELPKATFAHVIDAMAAAFIMTIVQFGPLTLERDAYFHPDEFTLLFYPRGVLDPGGFFQKGRSSNPPEIGDWYIRPLPAHDAKCTSWTHGHHPAITKAMEKSREDEAKRKNRKKSAP